MSKPLSISLADFNSQVATSVRAATDKIPEFKGSFDEAVFFPDLGLIGYILRDEFGLRSGKDLANFSTAMKGSLPGTPVTIIRDGKILMGYFPVQNELLIR